MTQYSYITLSNSNASLVRRFYVILGSMTRIMQKKQTLDVTIGGKLDLGQGSKLEFITYSLKVKNSATPPEGDKADLETFWNLSDPGGTPSDVITLTDHLGSSFTVYLLGEMPESPMAYLLEGDDARYIYQLKVVKIPT